MDIVIELRNQLRGGVKKNWEKAIRLAAWVVDCPTQL